MGETEVDKPIEHLFDELGEHIVGYARRQSTPYDIVAIGTQEADIADKAWSEMLRKALQAHFHGVNYVHVSTHSLMRIRLIVLANSIHANKISSCETSCVRTGVAGIGGNKGGVGIAFHFGATTLSFVSCHLAARAERRAKRSNMYHEICGNLNLGKKSKYSSFDLSHRFHYIFFLGDLNYRLEAGYESVLQQIRSCNYNELLKSDQLKQEQDAGNIFHGYKEGCIQFPPTYRYRRGARDDYIYAKLKPTGNVYNVPSYCDRILSHSFPHMKCNQTGYFCNLMFKASDHAPVIATYDIRVKHQYLWNRCENADGMEVGQSTKIKFPIIEARIKSRSGESSTFYLKLFSYLFEETVHSKPSPSLRADFSRTLMAPDIHASFCNSNVSHWSQADIPEIDPILPYIGYISNEYILIQIRSCSSDELYGQGVLSLQDKFNTDSERMFAIPLTCNELLCGELRGVVVLQGGNTAGMDDKVSFSDQITSPNTGAWIRDGSLSRVYR